MTFMTNSGRAGTMAEINIVPLIDVLLVLLVIFMVIAPNLSVGLHAAVPILSGDGGAAPVVVRLFADGSLKINGESSSWETLGPRLDEVFAHRATRAAFVEGADAVEFSEVARAIGVMHDRGIGEVGLLRARDFERQQ